MKLVKPRFVLHIKWVLKVHLGVIWKSSDIWKVSQLRAAKTRSTPWRDHQFFFWLFFVCLFPSQFQNFIPSGRLSFSLKCVKLICVKKSTKELNCLFIMRVTLDSNNMTRNTHPPCFAYFPFVYVFRTELDKCLNQNTNFKTPVFSFCVKQILQVSTPLFLQQLASLAWWRSVLWWRSEQT